MATLEDGCYYLWGAVIKQAIKDQGLMIRDIKTGEMRLSLTATLEEFFEPGGGFLQIAEFMHVDPEYVLRLITDGGKVLNQKSVGF